MISKRTVLVQREIVADGTIQIRLEKQVIDGDEVLFREPHRTVVEPGTSVDDQMDFVDGHLAQLGYPPLDKAGRDAIKRLVDLEHTPAVIAAHKRQKESAKGLPN